MIQRKQSIFLFLAALLNAGVFYFAFYKMHTVVNGVDTLGQVDVNNHYPSLLNAVVITILPLITIFMFGNRKRQYAMTFVSFCGVVCFIAMMLARVNGLGKATPPPTSGSYWIGAVLPVMSLVFLFLAILGIRKDDKLVKSMDRLR